jgi:hypothetical protein
MSRPIKRRRPKRPETEPDLRPAGSATNAPAADTAAKPVTPVAGVQQDGGWRSRLRKLTPDQQQLIINLYNANKKYTEIARRSRCSVGSCSGVITRARKAGLITVQRYCFESGKDTRGKCECGGKRISRMWGCEVCRSRDNPKYGGNGHDSGQDNSKHAPNIYTEAA